MQAFDFIEIMSDVLTRHCQGVPSAPNFHGYPAGTKLDVGSFAAEAPSQDLLSISIPTDAASA